MSVKDLLAMALFAVAVVLLVLCGWGVTFGHVGTLRMSWWALASGFAGLLVSALPPPRRV